MTGARVRDRERKRETEPGKCEQQSLPVVPHVIRFANDVRGLLPKRVGFVDLGSRPSGASVVHAWRKTNTDTHTHPGDTRTMSDVCDRNAHNDLIKQLCPR